MRFGLADITPAEALIACCDGCRCRHLDEQIGIAAACLDQQHAGVGVLAESMGQHTASRTSTDNNEVIGFSVGHSVRIHLVSRNDSTTAESLHHK